MKGKRMSARPRRRERRPFGDQIWSVYACWRCPFLDEAPYGDGKPAHSCRLISRKSSMGPRAQREEADRQRHLIADTLKAGLEYSWWWSPKFCPLRQDYPAGITVMYGTLDLTGERKHRRKVEDHYASQARRKDEARRIDAVRKKEREEAK